jgi:hypothetical protein
MDDNDPLGGEGGDGSRTQCDVPRAGERAPRRPYSDRGYDWEAIKHAVIHSDWSFDRIAAKYGPHPSTIRARAKKEGWVRLVGTVPLTPGRKPPQPGANKGGRPTAAETRRRNLSLRLFKVIDAKLKEIEARMQQQGESGAPPSGADTERDVRGVNTLMGLYAKLVELDEAARKDKEGSQSAATMRSEDAEALRRDLALRLDRLARARET